MQPMNEFEKAVIAAKDHGLDPELAMTLVDEGDSADTAVAKLGMATAIHGMTVQELSRLKPTSSTPMGIIQAMALAARLGIDG
jgi:hypothetical protein